MKLEVNSVKYSLNKDEVKQITTSKNIVNEKINSKNIVFSNFDNQKVYNDFYKKTINPSIINKNILVNIYRDQPDDINSIIRYFDQVNQASSSVPFSFSIPFTIRTIKNDSNTILYPEGICNAYDFLKNHLYIKDTSELIYENQTLWNSLNIVLVTRKIREIGVGSWNESTEVAMMVNNNIENTSYSLYNTTGNIDTECVYQLYFEAPENVFIELRIKGVYKYENLLINSSIYQNLYKPLLNNYHNSFRIFPYVGSKEISPVKFCEPLANKILLLKESNEWGGKSYNPEWNINNMENLIPGRCYQITFK